MLEGFDTLAEHAEKLDKSTRTLQRWISQPDGLPHTRRGRELLFKEEWTRDWLERGKVQRNPVPASRQPRRRARRASLSCATE
jgi:hypothetical protein